MENEEFVKDLFHAVQWLCDSEFVILKEENSDKYTIDTKKNVFYYNDKNKTNKPYRTNSEQLENYCIWQGRVISSIFEEKIIELYLYEKLSSSELQVESCENINPEIDQFDVKKMCNKTRVKKKRFFDLVYKTNTVLEIKFAHKYGNIERIGDTSLSFLFEPNYSIDVGKFENLVTNSPENCKNSFDKLKTGNIPFVKWGGENYATNLLSGQMLFDLIKLCYTHNGTINVDHNYLYYICFFEKTDENRNKISNLCNSIYNILCKFKEYKKLLEFYDHKGNFTGFSEISYDLGFEIKFLYYDRDESKIKEEELSNSIKLFCDGEKLFCFLLRIVPNTPIIVEISNQIGNPAYDNKTYYTKDCMPNHEISIYEDQNCTIQCCVAKYDGDSQGNKFRWKGEICDGMLLTIYLDPEKKEANGFLKVQK